MCRREASAIRRPPVPGPGNRTSRASGSRVTTRPRSSAMSRSMISAQEAGRSSFGRISTLGRSTRNAVGVRRRQPKPYASIATLDAAAKPPTAWLCPVLSQRMPNMRSTRSSGKNTALPPVMARQVPCLSRAAPAPRPRPRRRPPPAPWHGGGPRFRKSVVAAQHSVLGSRNSSCSSAIASSGVGGATRDSVAKSSTCPTRPGTAG